MFNLRTKRRLSYQKSVEFQNKILQSLGENLSRGCRVVACKNCRNLILQIVVADSNEFIFSHLPTIVILKAYTPNETWVLGRAYPKHEITADLIFRYIQRVKKCNCELTPAIPINEPLSDDAVDDAIRRLFPENVTIVDIDAVMLDTNFNIQAIFEFCSVNEKFKVVWVTKKVADYCEVDAYLLQVDTHGRILKSVKVDKEYIALGGAENG